MGLDRFSDDTDCGDFIIGQVAQQVERRIEDPSVIGSIPILTTLWL